MYFAQLNLHDDPNLGLFGFATDSYCVLGTKSKYDKKIKKILKVPVYHSSFMGTEFFGIFASGNSSGLAVPSLIMEDEIIKLKEITENIFGESKTLIIETYRAIGNLILMNDNGIILSPLIRREKNQLEEFFGIDCKVSTIAGLNVVGSLGFATNKGCLLHPKTLESEMKIIEEVLNVKCDIGTVSYGSPFPGSGIIANNNGFIASNSTSGPELGRITEALGFL